MFQSLKSVMSKVFLFSFILGSMFFSQNIKDAYYRNHIGDAVVRIYDLNKQGGGTGFHVETESGEVYILTNQHICELAKEGKLLIERNGEEMVREVLEVYPQHDLCLVEALSDPEGVIEIADSLEKGEDVIVVGHPGLRQLTLSNGEFIGEDHIELLNVKIETEQDCNGTWIENPFLIMIIGQPYACLESIISNAISAAIYGGNSGSPVVNKYGNLVGVVFAGNRSQAHDSHMVPLKNIQDFLKGL